MWTNCVTELLVVPVDIELKCSARKFEKETVEKFEILAFCQKAKSLVAPLAMRLTLLMKMSEIIIELETGILLDVIVLVMEF
jgi:hypothetical protein